MHVHTTDGETPETLHIELENVGSTSWWAGILTTLSSQTGSMTLRFVGRVNGRKLYTGDTFSSARGPAPIVPDEAFAPGMTESLTKLRRKIDQDGWVESGRGSQPWQLSFTRPTGTST